MLYHDIWRHSDLMDSALISRLRVPGSSPGQGLWAPANLMPGVSKSEKD